MKRLAAVAVMVALFTLPCCAQRGGSHGGSSGFHGGFSGSHAGFASHSSPSFHSAPPFRGSSGPVRGFTPGRFAGPPRFTGSRLPYGASGRLPYVSQPLSSRQPYSGANRYRMPYHSPYGRNRDDWGRRGRDRNRFGLYGWNVLPLWPGWGWGYPYLPDFFDYPDDYDSDTASNDAYSQPAPDYGAGPYNPPPDETGPQQPAYTPWPYSRPAPEPQPSEAPAPPASASDSPVTIIFRDGRAPETIHNYLLTATSLSVFDPQHQAVIPVDQIDLTATAQANRVAGVRFSLPGASR